MPRTVVYRAGGFTNCGIGYTKFSQEELAERRDRAMTENEAIEALKLEGGLEITGRPIRVAQFFEGIEVAIKALEEVQQYRAIGTPEECRAAMEKQTAKKPEFVGARFRNNGKHISDGCQLQKCYKCPNCNKHIFHVWDDELYCKYCGQHIDWRANDGKID
nr:MAG TPA: DNA-directed RNA polymerase subunit [Bacteriophage sp.]